MRRVTFPLLALSATVLAGCAAPAHPTVTFYADGHAIEVPPTQYCDIASENCAVDPRAAGVLRVRPGKPVQISVPGEIADSAWAVNFTYRNASGVRQEPLRSKVFTAADPRHAYTLTLPSAGDQLESVEIQQYGKRIESSALGIEFVARATWVLSVDDRG
ncbi:DUF2771 family protein [Saccharothrix violaceirubra]|uniref:DUF2771 family protein n=1 Tax=Saccharothrix violaceirubra TaxID=413306 RepID=A0A7W7T8W2_9PSEU|nr:DUF2771 family protein [Saccharothrix violaceirubra]MBB4968736.1 hypothetical protein [Saccharothrix violaceirubra]